MLIHLDEFDIIRPAPEGAYRSEYRYLRLVLKMMTFCAGKWNFNFNHDAIQSLLVDSFAEILINAYASFHDEIVELLVLNMIVVILCCTFFPRDILGIVKPIHVWIKR